MAKIEDHQIRRIDLLEARVDLLTKLVLGMYVPIVITLLMILFKFVRIH